MAKGGDTRKAAEKNGKRVGRPPGPKKALPLPKGAVGSALALHYLEMCQPPIGHDHDKCTCGECTAHRFLTSKDETVRLRFFTYLFDQAHGKATQRFEHKQIDPIQVQATLTLGEGMRLAMDKANKRLELFRETQK